MKIKKYKKILLIMFLATTQINRSRPMQQINNVKISKNQFTDENLDKTLLTKKIDEMLKAIITKPTKKTKIYEYRKKRKISCWDNDIDMTKIINMNNRINFKNILIPSNNEISDESRIKIINNSILFITRLLILQAYLRNLQKQISLLLNSGNTKKWNQQIINFIRNIIIQTKKNLLFYKEEINNDIKKEVNSTILKETKLMLKQIVKSDNKIIALKNCIQNKFINIKRVKENKVDKELENIRKKLSTLASDEYINILHLITYIKSGNFTLCTINSLKKKLDYLKEKKLLDESDFLEDDSIDSLFGSDFSEDFF